MNRHGPVLVVDDEPVARESLALWLREDGYHVDTATSGAEAIERARQRSYAVHLVDLKLTPGPDGIEVMRQIRSMSPDSAVAIITAFATVDTAIQAMKEGAQDYIVKPCNPVEISRMVKRLIRMTSLERENLLLRKCLTRRYSFRDLLSKNPRMLEVFGLIRRISRLKSTVLIQGESGTGKDLLARAIHMEGERALRPLISVSCGALTETLLESELFGHEKGSFTGALAQKRGKFEQADGGTIFLDDIQNIPTKLQMDLLHVLQDRKFFRVGGDREVEVDVRVIAATNRDLLDAVRAGTFREDLYYRLNVINILMPPLRERPEDIPLLARHFLERFAAEQAREVRDLSPDALAKLMSHPWPGNVRELENAVERALVTSTGTVLEAGDFSFLREQDGGDQAGGSGWSPPANLPLWQVERQVVEATLRRTGGNITEAAAILEIDRSTLYEKVKKYGIRR